MDQNELNNDNQPEQADQLTDLPVTSEQEERVTGGASTIVGHTTISNPSWTT